MTDPNPNPAPIVDPATPPVVPPIEERISKEEFLRVKNDMHKFKEDARKLQEELENKRIGAMKEKQDWEGIAKAKEQEAADFKEKYDGLSRSLVENAKHSALKNAALKSGILDQSLSDLELLDFAEVHVETTTTGKILVSGAENAIESLKKRRPHWFGTKPASVNPSSPETFTPSNGRVSMEDLGKLEKAYKENPQSSAAKKAYSDAIYTFKTQNPN